jgi:hypothetical protein
VQFFRWPKLQRFSVDHGLIDKHVYEENDSIIDKFFIKNLDDIEISQWINKFFSEKIWESFESIEVTNSYRARKQKKSMYSATMRRRSSMKVTKQESLKQNKEDSM